MPVCSSVNKKKNKILRLEIFDNDECKALQGFLKNFEEWSKFLKNSTQLETAENLSYGDFIIFLLQMYESLESIRVVWDEKVIGTLHEKAEVGVH